MEEVDGIIIHNLKSIGCKISDDVISLKQFPTELIIDATVRCLRLIKNDPNLSFGSHDGMSARFRTCSSLASAILELGYNGELGYQTFLYSSDTDIRKLFMFLVEKLPRAAAEITEESIGASVLLYRSVCAEIAHRLHSPWLPPYMRDNSIVWRGKPPTWHREGVSDMFPFTSCHLDWPKNTVDRTKPLPEAKRKYYESHLPLVSNQPINRNDVIASVLEANSQSLALERMWEHEWNVHGLSSNLTTTQYRKKKCLDVQNRVAKQFGLSAHQYEANRNVFQSQNLNQMIESMSGQAKSADRMKGSRFTHTEKLQFTEEETETIDKIKVSTTDAHPTEKKILSKEEIEQNREKEVEQLRSELLTLSTDINRLEDEIKKFSLKSQQIQEEKQQKSSQIKESRESLKLKKQTVDLLPNAEQNISKLNTIIENSSKRLLALADQWEKHRVPLIEQYREMKETVSDKQAESKRKLEEIREFREMTAELTEKMRLKDDTLVQLTTIYEGMTKDVNHSAYTRKIMEIVANIRKQKEEISRVLMDTKSVQKEINMLEGKLERTFTVADELIFQNAKRDDSAKKAYKLLASLHENCDQLIEILEDTGSIMREIRDHEEQIELERSKAISSNLQQLTDDLLSMKSENASMAAKLQEKIK